MSINTHLFDCRSSRIPALEVVSLNQKILSPAPDETLDYTIHTLVNSLFTLKSSESSKLYDITIDEDLFKKTSREDDYKKSPHWPPLSANSTNEFIWKIRHFGILNLLLHVMTKHSEYLNEVRPFSFIGDFPIWCLGPNPFGKWFENIGPHFYFSKVELEGFRGEPGEIEIEILLDETSKITLNRIEATILSFFKKNDSQFSVKGSEFHPTIQRNHSASSRGLSTCIEIKKWDILIRIFLITEPYTNNSLHFTLSADELRACDNSLHKSDIVICPKGIHFQGWHPTERSAIRYKTTTTTFASDDEAKHYDRFFIDASNPQKTLGDALDAFYSDIAPNSANWAFKRSVRCLQLRLLIQKLFPNEFHEYEMAICNAAGIDLLSKESTKKENNAFSTIATNPSIPCKIISGVLFLYGSLQEARKKLTTHHSNTSSETLFCAESFGQISFLQESISLSVDGEIVKTLMELKTHFTDHPPSKEISELFHQMLPCFFSILTHPKSASTPQEFTEQETALALQMAPLAIFLLDCAPLQPAAFLLLCLCGTAEHKLSYLPNLLKILPKLLISSLHANIRVHLLSQFLHYFFSCTPKDPLANKKNDINNFFICLKNSDRKQKAETLEALCKFFLSSHDSSMIEGTASIFELLSTEEIPPTRLRTLCQSLMNTYLSSAHKFFDGALDVYLSISSKQNISFDDKAAYLAKILAAFQNVNTTAQQALKLLKAFEELLVKFRPTHKPLNFLPLFPILLKHRYFDEALKLLNAEGSYGDQRLLLAEHYFSMGNIDVALTQWARASKTVDPEQALKVFGKWEKIVAHDEMQGPEENFSAVNSHTRFLEALFEACTPRFHAHTPLLIKLLVHHMRKINTASRSATPWTAYIPRGRWLLENFPKDANLADFPQLPSYESILREAKIAALPEAFAEAFNKIGAHLFYTIVCTSEDPLESIESLALVLLASHQTETQIAGFLLSAICGGHSPTSEAFERLFRLLPSLLFSAPSPSIRVLLLQTFCKSFNLYLTPVIHTQEYAELCKSVNADNSQEEISQAFYSTFIMLNKNEAIFETLHALWNGIPKRPSKFGLELIAWSLFHSPNKALMILNTLHEDSSLTFDSSEAIVDHIFSQAFQLYDAKKLPATQLKVLGKFVLLMSQNSRKSPSEKIQRWALDTIHLLLGIRSEIGEQLFDLIEEKKLFSMTPDEKNGLQLALCANSFAQGDFSRSFKRWKSATFIQMTPEFADLLLVWWEKGYCPELFKLTLESSRKLQPFATSAALFQCLIKSFRPGDATKLTLPKIELADVGPLFEYLENSSSAELFLLLFTGLIEKGFGPTFLAETFELYSQLTRGLEEEQTAGAVITIFTDSTAKPSGLPDVLSPENASDFYFLLAKKIKESHFDISLIYLKRALSVQISSKKTNSALFAFAQQFYTDLLKTKQNKEAESLLLALDSCYSHTHQKERLLNWKHLTLAYLDSDRVSAAQILIQKEADFKKTHFYQELIECSQTLFYELLRLKNQKLGLDVALLYLQKANFWIKALREVSTKDSSTKDALETLIKNFSFLQGKKRARQKCWTLILRLCHDHHIDLFSELIFHHKRFLSLFAPVSEPDSFKKSDDKEVSTEAIPTWFIFGKQSGNGSGELPHPLDNGCGSLNPAEILPFHWLLVGYTKASLRAHYFKDNTGRLLYEAIGEMIALKHVQAFYLNHFAFRLDLINTLLLNNQRTFLHIACVEMYNCLFHSKLKNIAEMAPSLDKALLRFFELGLSHDSEEEYLLSSIIFSHSAAPCVNSMSIFNVLKFYFLDLLTCDPNFVLRVCFSVIEYLNRLTPETAQRLHLNEKKQVKDLVTYLGKFPESVPLRFYEDLIFLHESYCYLIPKYERSQQGARILIRLLDNISTKRDYRGLKETLNHSLAYLKHITHPGEIENLFLDKYIEALQSLFLVYNDPINYFGIYRDILSQLVLNENQTVIDDWNRRTTQNLKNAAITPFVANSDDETLSNSMIINTHVSDLSCCLDVNFPLAGKARQQDQETVFTVFIEKLFNKSLVRTRCSLREYNFKVAHLIYFIRQLPSVKLFTIEKLFTFFYHFQLHYVPQDTLAFVNIREIPISYCSSEIAILTAGRTNAYEKEKNLLFKLYALSADTSPHISLNHSEVVQQTTELIRDLYESKCKYNIVKALKILGSELHHFFPYNDDYDTNYFRSLIRCYSWIFKGFKRHSCHVSMYTLTSTRQDASEIEDNIPSLCELGVLLLCDFKTLEAKSFDEYPMITIETLKLYHKYFDLMIEIGISTYEIAQQMEQENLTTSDSDDEYYLNTFDSQALQILPKNKNQWLENFTKSLISYLKKVAVSRVIQIPPFEVLNLLHKIAPMAAKCSQTTRNSFYEELKRYFNSYRIRRKVPEAAQKCLDAWIENLQEHQYYDRATAAECDAFRKKIGKVNS